MACSVHQVCPEANHPYLQINGIFFILLFLVLGYAAMFSPEKNNYPVPSVYNTFKEEPSPTTGLSRSFSSMIRGNFRQAYRWNSYGPGLFCFVVVELFMRVVLSILVCKRTIPVRILAVTDILLSLFLFGMAYGKLLLVWQYF